MASNDTTGTLKPNAPKNVRASRAAGSNEVVCEWDLGEGASSGKRKWTLDTEVKVMVYKKDGGKDALRATKTYKVGSTAKKCSHAIDLSTWYPHTKSTISKVVFEVRGRNGAGQSDAGTRAFTFGAVKPPAVSVGIDQDGNVTATAVARDGSSTDGLGYRTSTKVWVERSYNGGAWKQFGTAGTLGKLGSGSSQEVTSKYDPKQDSSTTVPISFRAAAANYGPAGPSATAYSTAQKGNKANLETGKVVFAQPYEPLLKSIVAKKDSHGDIRDVKADIDTRARGDRPVEHVCLQRLRNFDIDRDAAAAAMSSEWDDVGQGDGNCTGLQDSYTDGRSTVSGTRTWYRVYNTYKGYPPAYSDPKTAAWLEYVMDPSEAGDVSLKSVEPRDDGESLKVAMSWASKPHAVELSWAADKDAWSSTGGASTHDIDEPAEGGQEYVITGLTEGETYYVRARPWIVEDGGGRAYGNYSATVACLAASVPKEVVLSAPAYVLRGQDVPLSWRFTSGKPQKAWSVSVDGAAVASGEGTAKACKLPASALGPRDAASLSVSVTTGGAYGDSPEAEVAVVDVPSCSLEVGSRLGAQPLSVAVLTDCEDPVVSVSVASAGCSAGSTPGEREQAEGDVVWGGSFREAELDSIVWTAKGARCVVSLPEGVDFRDGVGYMVTARVSSERWGVSSEPAAASFAVEWAHQAEPPTGSVAPDPAGLSCEVSVDAPASAADGDVFDLYRVTPDGEYLIAEGAAFGTALTDPYAPYRGSREDVELCYHAVTRTADGDTAGTYDLEYDLVGHGVRLDWGGKSLALEYDVDMSDSWEKAFERVVHADGTAEGRWSPGARRSSSVQADLVKFSDSAQRRLLADAAGHAGPVLVRNSRGQAFPADVQPSEVAYEHGSLAVRVSLSAQEVGMVPEFMAREA